MSEFYTNIEAYGNNLLVRGYKNGVQFSEKVKFSPKLYTPTNKDSKFKSIADQVLEENKFETISDARDFIERYKGVDNFKFYGMEKWVTQYISEKYWSDIKYDFSKIRILPLDIETASDGGYSTPAAASQPITAITLILNDIIYALGYGDFHTDDPKVKYYKFTDEKSLLRGFITIFSKYNPDIITGWNSEGYDISYLVNRIKNLLGEDEVKRLSPWGIVKPKTVPTMRGMEVDTYDIWGVAHLDYMLLFRKMSGKTPESYKLDQVAYEILGKKKVDYSKYGSLSALYKENHQLFIEYNIQDTKLIVELEERMKLIQLVCLIAYYSKVNYIDTFKNTRVWDSLIYNHLLKKNVIVDSKFDNEDSKDRILGGYVQLPQKGMYDWVVTFDATSLYPHIIMSENISPDTFHSKFDIDVDTIVETSVNPHKEFIMKNNLSMAGNGATFRKDKKGFLVELMEELFELRKSYKDMMNEKKKEMQSVKDEVEKKELQNLVDYYNNYQNVFKIILNSAFGAMAAKGFRYEHSHFGEGITMSGQLILKWGVKYCNQFLNKLFKTENENYVIYADTDSIVLNLSKYGLRFKDKNESIEKIDELCKKVMAQFFDKIYDNLANVMNFYENKIHFKREKICDRGIFLDEKKKRYILNVWDEEGTRFNTPETKVTGIEAVRSSTPEIVRKALKETFVIMMNKTEGETLQFIDKFEVKFKESTPEDIAMPKSANNLDQYTDGVRIYGKGTPIHVRAALLYNHHLKDKNLVGKYEEILDGEKIKYLHLKTPNPIQENIIGFPKFLPPELDLHKYIDWDMQFDKTYLSPLKTIFQAVSWKTDNSISLDDFI